MKIRTALLGTVALAGLTTAGYAADLGVVTSLDVCDELGLSGLTISSDDNCLVITGNVSFEYDYGNYQSNTAPPVGATVFSAFARNSGTVTVPDDVGGTDSKVDIDWWLQFVGESSTSFGPAKAVIRLFSNDSNGSTVGVKQAWVGVGDTTMLMAGIRDASVFADGDDTPLNYLGLFNSSNVSTGVGFTSASPTTGGTVIQVVHNLGNGLSISGGLENLASTTTGTAPITAVGTIAYAGDGITAHASGAIDQANAWKTHAGFTGTFDKVTVGAAIAANSAGGPVWWNALGTASLALDMFTLAVSGEATSANEYGVGGSITATVSDGVSINLGGRYFKGTTQTVSQIEAGVSAAVTEAITVSGAVGAYMGTAPSLTSDYYGKIGAKWVPGTGFSSEVSLEGHSTGGYKAVFKASKSIN